MVKSDRTKVDIKNRETKEKQKGKMQGVPIFNGIPCIFSCFLEAYVLY